MSAFKTTLRRAWPVLVAYGLFSIWGVGCLVLSLVLTSGGFGVSAGDAAALVGVLIATVIGHVGGNLLGLAGFRMMPILAFFTAITIGSLIAGVALGPFVLYVIVAIFAAGGGYLGVASRLDVVACWYPLVFSIGGAIHWMNHHDALATFHGGSKHALWDGFTMVCLTGAVFLMLVFLATRHSLGLTVWQEVGRARGEEENVAVARPGRGSFGVLFVFTLIVIGATALLSPYLFRTAEAKDGDKDKSAQQGDGQGQQGEGQGTKKQKKRGNGSGNGNGDGEAQGTIGDSDPEGAAEQAKEAFELGLKIFLWLLVAAIVLLLLTLLLFPPLRRSFLLRHLERPLWPVAPTSRVMNLWRRALAALAVLEIAPGAGETPQDFARRAESELERIGCPAPGIKEAAAIVEKIDYAGRGLGAGEEDKMRAAVQAFVALVTSRTGFRRRLGAGWGSPPEVES